MPEKTDDIVCLCMYVYRSTIEDAIWERDLTTVSEVGEFTEAGTNCGGCQDDIREILHQLEK